MFQRRPGSAVARVALPPTRLASSPHRAKGERSSGRDAVETLGKLICRTRSVSENLVRLSDARPSRRR
jgi:hypothetical protein